MSLAEEYVSHHSSWDFEEDETHSEVTYGLGWELVDEEYIEEHRWYDVWSYVYELPDKSYVRFLQNNPSTEMQEGQGFGLRCQVVYPKLIQKTIFNTVRV